MTGASRDRGIGYATCTKFNREGALVVLTDFAETEVARNHIENAAKSIDSTKKTVVPKSMDVTDIESVSSLFESILNDYGRVDIVVNNAGTDIGAKPFHELTDEEWEKSFNVNVRGCANVCRAALPIMIEQHGGCIVNNASLAGLRGYANQSAYSSSKFAVVGLTKSLACEYGKHNIRVNSVCPGLVWTNMGEQAIHDLQLPGETHDETKLRLANTNATARWADPNEIASVISFLASKEASYINGAAMEVTGGCSLGL